MKIGFFDSGLGGLTILRAVIAALPQYDYVYFGDTVNLPYGNKSEAEVQRLTQAGIIELFSQDCLLVIVACNTASAETLRTLQDTWLPVAYPDRRILGVIVPTVEEFNDSGNTSVSLLATQRTVDSGKYDKELRNRNIAGYSLTSIAAPELVPLIESGAVAEAARYAIARIEAEAAESQVIILGCTHYTEMKTQLREHFPTKIILSQDEIIPKKLSTYLHNHPELQARLSQTGSREIFLTAKRPEYSRITDHFLGNMAAGDAGDYG